MLLLIAAVFALAGFVKGVIGLGLPTVAMGLLAVAMTPLQALTIVVVPAVVTNIWQTFAGPYLRGIVVRSWPLLAGTAVAVAASGAPTAGPHARYGTIVLGLLLVVYAALGLTRVQFRTAPRDEWWVGGLAGLVTGVISAATGIQVIPSMPFLQSIGLERDELVQALGVFFTVATVAQAFNLTSAGLLNASTALPGLVAMAAAFAGMAVGQVVRCRMDPARFRRWFLIAMGGLGLYLSGSAVASL